MFLRAQIPPYPASPLTVTSVLRTTWIIIRGCFKGILIHLASFGDSDEVRRRVNTDYLFLETPMDEAADCMCNLCLDTCLFRSCLNSNCCFFWISFTANTKTILSFFAWGSLCTRDNAAGCRKEQPIWKTRKCFNLVAGGLLGSLWLTCVALNWFGYCPPPLSICSEFSYC